MAITLSTSIKSIKKQFNRIKKTASSFINLYPLASFFGLLGLLFLVIVASNFIRRSPEVTDSEISQPKLVRIHSFTQVPTMTFSATVEKSGVINIYAQSPGIVQKINVTEGSYVSRGQALVSLSTNYQGGNVASISRQIAQKNHDSTVETYDAQIDIITKQKDLATKGETQAEELREISRKSIDETKDLIKLNEDIIDRINEQIELLQSTNVGGANDAAIFGALQGKAGAQSGLTQLRSGLRSLEYQSSDDEVGAEMTELNRDVAVKQLELQEKSLTLVKEISSLNLKLAQISESLMYPASPVYGVVERVHVSKGESVNPGTLLATIRGKKGENTAVVSVTRDVARQISITEASQLQIGDSQVNVFPRYISREATNGNLHTVLYDLPSEYGPQLTNTELIQVQIPLGTSIAADSTSMVPLDAVYQTQDKSYLTVVRKNDDGQLFAQTIEVSLGEISGSYVEVLSGVTADDQVITSRNVQDGDLISIQE